MYTCAHFETLKKTKVQKIYSKVHLLAVCLLTVVFLVGCGSGEASEAGGGEASDGVSKTLTLEKDQMAQHGKFKFTLLGVKESLGILPSGEQKKGVAAEVKIEKEGESGGYITLLFEGIEEIVDGGARVGDRPVGYTLTELSEEKQTATLSRKVGEPLE